MATTSPRRGSGGHGRQRSATAQTKAATKAKPRRGADGATKAKAKKATGKASTAASKTKETVKEVTPSMPKPTKLASTLAAKAVKKVGTKMLEAAAERIRALADRAAETGHEAVEKTAQQRLPIQVSVDIAVPLHFAWEEWMALECLPEGVHNVTDIERDGDVLVGRTTGRRPKDWEAEIHDEREQQSFAWQSYEGSDCAGLATFHALSDRLTRIELDLDVVPTSVPETFELAVRLADKHAQAELRRFKARLEFINPDVYEKDAPEPEDDAEPEGPEEPEEDTDEQDEAA